MVFTILREAYDISLRSPHKPKAKRLQLSECMHMEFMNLFRRASNDGSIRVIDIQANVEEVNTRLTFHKDSLESNLSSMPVTCA